jgi:hypothetical protein
MGLKVYRRGSLTHIDFLAGDDNRPANFDRLRDRECAISSTESLACYFGWMRELSLRGSSTSGATITSCWTWERAHASDSLSLHFAVR